MTDGTVEPVSTIVSRTVPAAKVVEFEQLLHEVITAAREYEGHLGVDVLRPEAGGVYQIVFRYRGRPEYEAWMASDQRRRLVTQIDELLDDGRSPKVRTVDGWEGWFVSSDYAPPVPPRRWKMALITIAALYPIALAMILVLRALTGGWPLPLALLLTMGLTIPLMTWVIMPQLTVRLGRWLRR